MANDELKAAAQKELMRRKAKAELDRRRSSAPAYEQSGMMDAISRVTPIGMAKQAIDVVRDPVGQGKKALDVARVGLDGLTFGFGDRAISGITGKDVADVRADTKAAGKRLGEPDALLSSLAGGALTGGGLLKAGVTATKIPRIGGALGLTADGAALGAVNAAGHGDNVATGALIGGAGGAVGQMISPIASRVAGLANKKPVLPSVDDLAAQSKAAYQQAENAGVTIKPEAMERLRKGVYDDFADFGYHPELQPGAKIAYGELDRLTAGGNVDLKGLEGLRKIAGGGFTPTNPSNNALLGKTTGKIDEFLESLGPNDVISGDPALASSSLKEARRLWGQKAKLSRVEKLLEDAGLQSGSTGSGGNIENASRQKLKTLLTNPKLTRGMTKDEIEATKKAVIGTKPQNALRLLGKLSPQGNGLMMALQAFGAGATGGMTLPLAAAGYGSKVASEAITRKNAELLKAIIAGGGSKAAVMPPKNATQKAIERNKELIARLLTLGSVAPVAGN